MRIPALLLLAVAALTAACGADGIPRHPDAPQGTPFPMVERL